MKVSDSRDNIVLSHAAFAKSAVAKYRHKIQVNIKVRNQFHNSTPERVASVNGLPMFSENLDLANLCKSTQMCPKINRETPFCEQICDLLFGTHKFNEDPWIGSDSFP